MEYLTVKQVRDQTGLSYSTVIKYANIGILPAVKIPNGKKAKYLFPAKELEAKLKSLRVAVA